MNTKFKPLGLAAAVAALGPRIPGLRIWGGPRVQHDGDVGDAAPRNQPHHLRLRLRPQGADGECGDPLW